METEVVELKNNRRIKERYYFSCFHVEKTLYAGNDLMLRENTFKHNLNLLTRNGAYNLMAVILADRNSYSIKIAVFRGTDKTDLIKRNEYGYKCMLVAVKQVLGKKGSVKQNVKNDFFHLIADHNVYALRISAEGEFGRR